MPDYGSMSGTISTLTDAQIDTILADQTTGPSQVKQFCAQERRLRREKFTPANQPNPNTGPSEGVGAGPPMGSARGPWTGA